VFTVIYFSDPAGVHSHHCQVPIIFIIVHLIVIVLPTDLLRGPPAGPLCGLFFLARLVLAFALHFDAYDLARRCPCRGLDVVAARRAGICLCPRSLAFSLVIVL
jgi:hypothetical protein